MTNQRRNDYARASTLCAEIDRLFAMPRKRTLKHGEALDVIAKMDGARNHHVIGGQPDESAGFATRITPGNDWLFAEGPRTAEAIDLANAVMADLIACYDEMVMTDGRSHEAAGRELHQNIAYALAAPLLQHHAMGSREPQAFAEHLLRRHVTDTYGQTQAADVTRSSHGYRRHALRAALAKAVGAAPPPRHQSLTPIRPWKVMAWQGRAITVAALEATLEQAAEGLATARNAGSDADERMAAVDAAVIERFADASDQTLGQDRSANLAIALDALATHARSLGLTPPEPTGPRPMAADAPAGEPAAAAQPGVTLRLDNWLDRRDMAGPTLRLAAATCSRAGIEMTVDADQAHLRFERIVPDDQATLPGDVDAFGRFLTNQVFNGAIVMRTMLYSGSQETSADGRRIDVHFCT